MKPEVLGIHLGSFSTLGSLSIIAFPIRNAPQGDTDIHCPVFCLPQWLLQKLLRGSMWNEPLSEVQSTHSSCILLLDFGCQREHCCLRPIVSGLHLLSINLSNPFWTFWRVLTPHFLATASCRSLSRAFKKDTFKNLF